MKSYGRLKLAAFREKSCFFLSFMSFLEKKNQDLYDKKCLLVDFKKLSILTSGDFRGPPSISRSIRLSTLRFD
jgi:hypothetical protein